MKYAAHGKQVKRGLEHVADAEDETWAQIIADALNDRGAMTDPDGTVWRPVTAIDYAPAHTLQRQQDEYACSCGARWDVSDGDEHPPTR